MDADPIATEHLPVSQLHPHLGNYNRHPAAQVEKLRASLRAFGHVRSIVVQSRPDGDYTILAGHGIVEAAQAENLSHLAARIVPADWSPAKVAAYLVADNEPAREAERDDVQLLSLLEEVQAHEPALLEAAGFGQAEMEQLLRLARPQEPDGDDPGAQVERAEELREQWQVETGQIWQLGEHRLICGDCTDADVVKSVLREDRPLLMVTDPPYGVNYDPSWRNEAAAAGWLSYAPRRIGEVQNDDRVDWSDAYKLFSGDVAYTWSPGGDHVILTGLSLQAAGFQIRNQIIWVKPHFPISRGHYTYQHEPCWYGVRKGATAHWIGDNTASTRWDITLDANVEGGHSTQKPLECMARPIRNHDSEFVYEPFCGSGTTIIACEQLKRKCRAVEISPAYVAVALQRWADMTGQAPQLMGGG